MRNLGAWEDQAAIVGGEQAREEFLRDPRGDRGQATRHGSHSEEFRFSFTYKGEPLEDFKVREWKDLVCNAKK